MSKSFNYLIIVLLFLTLQLVLSDSNFIENNNLLLNNNKSLILCKDGKGPLLEGEGYIFKCFDNNCPNGFICELLNNKNEGGGICCPNLTELFKLYNEESVEIKGESNEKIIKERDEKLNNKQNQSEKQPIINAMELLEKHYGKIIAREKPKEEQLNNNNKTKLSELISSVREDSPVFLNEIKKEEQIKEANIWKPKILNSNKRIFIDSSGEEFSCKRQRLEPFCENNEGNKKTQFVIRWFAKEGICYSYPWGYCPGEPIATDKTLRTLKECEELCTNNNKLNNNKNKIKEPFLPISGIVRLTEEENNEEKENNNNEILKIKKEQKFNEIKTTKTLNNIEENNNKINENNNSLISYNSIIKKEEVPPSSASAELAEYLLLEQKIIPKIKKCEKITPYRTKCNLNGLNSQFTLRWYQRGNNCFAYPYGYCNNEEYEEEPIKTEKECLSICIQRRGNEWKKRRV